jgi:hypothetical protein
MFGNGVKMIEEVLIRLCVEVLQVITYISSKLIKVLATRRIVVVVLKVFVVLYQD